MQTIKTYIKKVKLINPLTSFKKWLLTDLMVDAERLEHRVDSLENQTSIDDVDNRVDNLEYDLESRIESVEDRSETNQESIKILKDKFNVLKHNIESDKENLFVAGTLDTIDDLCDKVDNLEELAKKYLQAELQTVELKQQKTEANLSAMQKLSFEICKYYGGDFNLDDFNKCYDIINKYDVKEVK